MHRHHDIGGLPAGPVDQSEHDNALWEKRVDALMVVLTVRTPQEMTVDELRRGIEDLPPDAYEAMSYYERWIHSIATIMKDRGVLSADEIETRVAEVKARYAEAG